MEESLGIEKAVRDNRWTESIAVGSKEFVTGVKNQLGMRSKGRRITEKAGDCLLRETQLPYIHVSEGENSPLSSDNLHSWDVYPGTWGR